MCVEVHIIVLHIECVPNIVLHIECVLDIVLHIECVPNAYHEYIQMYSE